MWTDLRICIDDGNNRGLKLSMRVWDKLVRLLDGTLKGMGNCGKENCRVWQNTLMAALENICHSRHSVYSIAIPNTLI